MQETRTGNLSLDWAWKVRLSLRAEGNKLRAEGDKLHAEGSKLHVEGDKLWAEGSKLHAEGDKLWAEAVIKAHGNIIMEWRYNSHRNDSDCYLETGEIFGEI